MPLPDEHAGEPASVAEGVEEDVPRVPLQIEVGPAVALRVPWLVESPLDAAPARFREDDRLAPSSGELLHAPDDGPPPLRDLPARRTPLLRQRPVGLDTDEVEIAPELEALRLLAPVRAPGEPSGVDLAHARHDPPPVLRPEARAWKLGADRERLHALVPGEPRVVEDET